MLAFDRMDRQRLRSQRRPGQMTIIVGVIFKDGIVVASDSQGTAFLGVDVKRLDIQKVYSFESTSQGTVDRLIVAGSGSDAYITRGAEIVGTTFRGGRFSSCRDVVDIVEDAVTTLYKPYV